MLAIKNLDVIRGRSHVLHGIDLDVHKGEIVALIGSNGAGKTTLLQTVSGLLPAKKGSIFYQCEERAPIDLIKTSAEKTVAAGVCHCPEGRGVFSRLSVYENLLMGAYLRTDNVAIESDIERMYALFPILKEYYRKLAGTLSGGEQMMLAVARALMGCPKLLLLDEPSLGLAPQMIDKIFEYLQQINLEGITVLLVEQNAMAALDISHRAYVLEHGHIAMTGKSSDLIGDDSIRKAYLGGE